MVSKAEIVHTLNPINNIHFHICDLNEYADKIYKLGKSLEIRNDLKEITAYILYYDNSPVVYISMVWTHPKYRGKGLAKRLLKELIASTNKNIKLEVHKENPALKLYKKFNFKIISNLDSKLTMIHSKSIAIMQPYIFPYLGYFHLIEATNIIVFYDDVNYIKRGWINRNNILINNSEFLFTIPVKKASQNKLINEINISLDKIFISKFLKQLEFAYLKAPYFSEVYRMVEKVLNSDAQNIADLSIKSILAVYSYLGREINWVKSSKISGNTKNLNKADRLIKITKDLGYMNYINAKNGQKLYSKTYFKENGIELNFINSQIPKYKQFNNNFVPNLSIIDILMFNNKEDVLKQFKQFELI